MVVSEPKINRVPIAVPASSPVSSPVLSPVSRPSSPVISAFGPALTEPEVVLVSQESTAELAPAQPKPSKWDLPPKPLPKKRDAKPIIHESSDDDSASD